MNRNIVIIAVLVVALALVASLVLLGLNPSFLNPQKFEVTNVRLTYGSQAYGSFQAFVVFTLRNLDDSYLNTVGVAVDGVNFGLSALQIPPGQTQEKSLPLGNLVLSSSKTYGITLTFTFADGKYQDYSGSYTTPVFKGQVTVTSLSLTLFTYLYNFHVEVKNTGNLPITMAKYRFSNGFEQILSPMYALPGQTLSGGESLFRGSLVEGSAYPVTIQVTYFDGSTSTISTSVVAQS
ncbi:MAG: hypothetical protein ACFFAL_12325 [Promethearchaeota archaeon]